MLFLCLLSSVSILLPGAGCGRPAWNLEESVVETGADWKKEKILPVQNIQQMPELPSGCEITSAAIVLNYLGYEIKNTELAQYFPIGGMPYRSGGSMVGPDPWKEFAGEPSQNGYGCFAPVVTSAVNRYLSAAGSGLRAVNLSGTKASGLSAYLDAGIPVIVWATISMEKPYPGDSWVLEGTRWRYRWPAREHCLVLIGYSGGKAVFSDPLDPKGTVLYDFTVFQERYRQMYCQAVVIEAANH